MNPIEFLAALINVICMALPADEMRIGQEDFLVKRWACTTVHKEVVQVASYQRLCPKPNPYYGRPYYLDFPTLHEAVYLNRFGEVQQGYGARLEEAYVPLCGS